MCTAACIRDMKRSVYEFMCKIFSFVSAAGLEVIVSGNPTVRLLVPPLTHRLLISLCLCLGKWNLQLIDINRICGRRGAGTWDVDESGNLIWLDGIDSPPT